MKPSKLDLLIQKGSTFRKVFKLRQTNGMPVDLSGCSIRSKFRKSHESSVEFSLNASIVDPVDGKCQLLLSPEETEAIQVSTGVYDVEIVFLNSEVQQVLFGNVLIKKEATYG